MYNVLLKWVKCLKYFMLITFHLPTNQDAKLVLCEGVVVSQSSQPISELYSFNDYS